MIPGYPKILQLGHKRAQGLYDASQVWIEEKVDGSQFSAQLGEDGVLRFRSKRSEVFTESAGMFAAACAHFESVKDLLVPGWVYRGEAFRGPKHNVISYARAPKGNFVLWDVEVSPGAFLPTGLRKLAAEQIDVEPVPVLAKLEPGQRVDKDLADKLLQTESVLGGHKIEGFVVKQHEVFDREGGLVLGKFVSESFKEKHRKADNPGGDTKKEDVLDQITAQLATKARWAKARQRLEEEGGLTGTPKDIGTLITYAQQDIVAEEREWISQRLYAAFAQRIIRASVRGLPEWYKAELLLQECDQ